MDRCVAVDHRSMCSLDSLPADVLIAIFVRLPCLADLSSVVQVSRSLHRCFQVHKRAVFLGMLSYDFIPVMKDAVAAATTPRVASWWGREQRIRHAMQRYQSLGTRPEVDGRVATWRDHQRRASQDCRVLFCGFLFFEFRRHDLRRVSPAAAAAGGPPSSHERQRLSAAFLRYQLATTLHPYNARTAEVLGPFFSAFAAWEAEQIHQAHVFVSQLCVAMESIHTNAPDEPSGQLERRYTKEYIYDVSILRKAVKSATDTDPGLMSRVSDYMAARKSLYGTIGFLNASHDFPNERMAWRVYSDQAAEDFAQKRSLRSELYLKERSMPALVAGPSVAEPPFGWVDALDGLDCRRWGKDLPRFTPGKSTPYHYREIDGMLRRWKRLGLLFWDQGRVEQLKSALPEYARGWLLNIGN